MAGLPREHVVKVRTEVDNAAVVRPGDKLVIATPNRLSVSDADVIKAHYSAKLPGTEIVLVDQCSSLAVYRDEQPDDNAIERWIRSNPKKFEAWVLRYNRIHAGLRELRR